MWTRNWYSILENSRKIKSLYQEDCKVLNELKEIGMNIVEHGGYWGIFMASVVGSCMIPIPSEVIMPLAGALSVQGQMNVLTASVVGAVGNVAGSLMAYGIGYKVPEAVILRFIKKWGKWILLTEHEYKKAKTWLQSYGELVSFFSRLIPGVRAVVSLPAGVAQIKLLPFVIWTFLGSLLWCTVLTWAGYVLGNRWETLEGYFKKFEIAIIAAGLTLIAFVVWKKVRRK